MTAGNYLISVGCKNLCQFCAFQFGSLLLQGNFAESQMKKGLQAVTPQRRGILHTPFEFLTAIP
jgi:hypothetical protein